ncbi:MAG: hypothetical protein AAFY02_19865 [Pseudomonadota bacterium]
MKTADPPFIPPIRGCRLDRVHHLGPFITHVDFLLPDGSPYVWTSRGHRWLGGVKDLSSAAKTAEVDARRWWLEVAGLARIGWWTATLFMIGASCFILASAAGLFPGLFGRFAQSPTAINLTFFIGSLFFTTAAWLQLLAAVNADRIAAIAHRAPLRGQLRWFAWRPHEIGWLSAFSQFVGTLLFNLNTLDALLPGLGWLQQDLLIWTPDVIGSVCFLTASVLAAMEYAAASRSWDLGDVSWWVVVANLLGSLAFGVAAVYSVVLPGSEDVLDAQAVNAYTCLGAFGFLVGAALLFPELGRNVRRVVAASKTT